MKITFLYQKVMIIIQNYIGNRNIKKHLNAKNKTEETTEKEEQDLAELETIITGKDVVINKFMMKIQENWKEKEQKINHL